MRRSAMMFAVVVMVTMGVGAVAAGAATINVPAAYPTIQGAISAAANGDTIVVAPGTYPESLEFQSKNLVLRSSAPQNAAVVAATIIRPAAGKPTIRIAGAQTASTVVSGFTISHSGVNNDTGIAVWASSPIIEHNVFSGNGYGGIDISGAGASALAQYNEVIGGSTTIYLGNHSTATVAHNIVRDSVYNGIMAYTAGAKIIANTVYNCEYGIWVELPSAAAQIVNNTVRNCGHDGVTVKTTTALVKGNLVYDNVGAGVSIAGSGSPVVDSNTIYHCGANGSGNLRCAKVASPTISNCIIANAVAGGGICAEDAAANSMTISYCDLFANMGGNYRNLPNQTGTNGNITVDPQFVDAAAGNFRLKSCNGYNVSGLTWAKAKTSSPCLDAGKPASAYANEPTPNGGRINLGYDGGTTGASKSSMVATRKPANGVTGVGRSTPLSIAFMWPMNTASVQTHFSLTPQGGVAVACSYTWTGTTKVSIQPNAQLLANKLYTMKLNTGILRQDGSTISWTESSTFTTGIAAASVLAVTASAQPVGSGAAQVTVKLTSAASVQAIVYNMAGRVVATLRSQDLAAGVSTLTWGGKSDTGATAPAGRYLVRVIAHSPDGSSANCLAPLSR